MTQEKQQVHDFWDEASCGETLLLSESDKAGYNFQSSERYRLEPYIHSFAEFDNVEGKKVLEIGVGLGADHQKFAEGGADLFGVDLTERAIAHTKSRIKLFGLESILTTGDAENLEYTDNTFDMVYSWGVVHHSPDTEKAIAEIFRVLKPGGKAKIMIYHKWSMIGFMLWLRYGLFKFRPFIGLSAIYSLYLESPGTKAYSIKEGHDLFSSYSDVQVSTVLSHGDLLESDAGQRHRGLLLTVAKKLWPRFLIRRVLPKAGLFMLIEGVKP